MNQRERLLDQRISLDQQTIARLQRQLSRYQRRMQELYQNLQTKQEESQLRSKTENQILRKQIAKQNNLILSLTERLQEKEAYDIRQFNQIKSRLGLPIRRSRGNKIYWTTSIAFKIIVFIVLVIDSIDRLCGGSGLGNGWSLAMSVLGITNVIDTVYTEYEKGK